MYAQGLRMIGQYPVKRAFMEKIPYELTHLEPLRGPIWKKTFLCAKMELHKIKVTTKTATYFMYSFFVVTLILCNHSAKTQKIFIFFFC